MFPLILFSVGLLLPASGESSSDLAAWIDARLEAVWRAKGITPRPVVDDEIFLRRAFLDLTGTIPSVAEARDFLDSKSGGKRERLIDSLLEDKRYSEHFAALWARTLAPAGNTRGALEAWLRQEFRKNTPFHRLSEAILTARGDSNVASPAAFYLAVGNTPERVAEAVARGFLGVRLGCAQCHNHPFTGWKREHFWGLAAFFAGTSAASGQVNEGGTTRISPMDSSLVFEARFLEGPAPQFSAGRSPRAVLADWLTGNENRFFAANVVNRVWQDLCGTGLVSTIDDLDTIESEEKRLVLEDLAKKFTANGFNMRWLVEGICFSQAYQRASLSIVEPGSSQRPVRTLSPNQVFAALDQALSLKKGRGLSPKYTPEGRILLARLEEARGSNPSDYKGGIPQALLFMNGSLITQATTLEESLTLRAIVEAPFLKDTDKLEALFLAAYSRLPRAEERERFLAIIRENPSDSPASRQAYANIFWALLNSPEFVLCP